MGLLHRYMGNPQARKIGRKTSTLQTFSHDTHSRKTTSLLNFPKSCALCKALTKKEGEEAGIEGNQINKKKTTKQKMKCPDRLI